MNKTRSILVYVGADAADNAALKTAFEVATQTGARLEVVSVVPDIPAYSNLVFPSEVNIPQLVFEDRARAVQSAIRDLGGTNISITTNILRGKPAIELTRYVQERGHDLVMKMARPDEAGGLFYGPVAAQLMRICPRPVWIVQPDQPARLKRILAAVDPNPACDDKTALNIRVLELATSLAKLHDAEVIVLHAWDALGVDLLKKRISEADLARYLTEHEQDAKKRVAELMTYIADAPRSARVSLPRGDAREVVPRYAAELESDLVVMGTVSRTGIAGFFIGNTAESVLRKLHCSMLTIKPPGFISPVEVQHGTLQDSVPESVQ